MVLSIALKQLLNISQRAFTKNCRKKMKAKNYLTTWNTKPGLFCPRPVRQPVLRRWAYPAGRTRETGLVSRRWSWECCGWSALWRPWHPGAWGRAEYARSKRRFPWGRIAGTADCRSRQDCTWILSQMKVSHHTKPIGKTGMSYSRVHTNNSEELFTAFKFGATCCANKFKALNSSKLNNKLRFKKIKNYVSVT